MRDSLCKTQLDMPSSTPKKVVYIPDEDAKADSTKAPVALMTDLLKSVQEENTEAVLRIAERILAIEPHNRLVLEYRSVFLGIQAGETAEAKEGTSSSDSEGHEEWEDVVEGSEDDSGRMDSSLGEGKDSSDGEGKEVLPLNTPFSTRFSRLVQ